MTDGAAGGRWADLGPRVGTAAVLVGLGAAAIWAGGPWFAALVVAAVSAIVWEVSVMAGSARPRLVAGLAGAALVVALVVPQGWGVGLALVPVAVAQPLRARTGHAMFVMLAILAGYGLVELRGTGAPLWLLWLVGVVVLSDIAGYFAGKLIAGPKFWPHISPKKTWSGTVAGWVCAAALGAVTWAQGLAGPEIVALSIVVALAAQLGDIAQSAMKRRVGVKDSSNLLPGHGGVFDRFDGLLAASVCVLVMGPLLGFPPVSP